MPLDDLAPLVVWERIVIAIALGRQSDRISAGPESVEEVLLIVKRPCWLQLAVDVGSGVENKW